MFLAPLNGLMLRRRHRLACGVMLNERANERILESFAVVALVALLVALAINGYRPFVDKARMIEAVNLINNFRPDVVEYFAVNGRLPDELGLSDGAPVSAGKFFPTMFWDKDEIVFDLGYELSNRVSDVPISVFQPSSSLQLSFRVASSADGGRQLFLCGDVAAPAGFTATESRHTNVPDELLPFFCRS